MITTLEDFKVYNRAMKLGEDVWAIVSKWNYFQKDTIGKQFDSIAANLSEGLGRYHYKDSKNFAYYSRGSLFETKTWLAKAFSRGLVNEVDNKKFDEELNIIGKMLNAYINSIGTISEPEENYRLTDANA
jgi:four helix bundle protein